MNTKKYMSFRLKFLLGPWKDNIWDPWKDSWSQKDSCIASWSEFARNIEKKINNKPYVFFIKVDLIFPKWQYGSTHIVPDSSFSKNASEIKHEHLMEIYKESLRRQCGSDWILERTMWVRLYYLLKIDDNFMKGQHGSNHTVF